MPRTARPMVTEIVTLLIEHNRPKSATDWAWTVTDAPEAVASVTVLGAAEATRRTAHGRTDLRNGSVVRDKEGRVYVYAPINDRDQQAWLEPLDGSQPEGYEWRHDDDVEFPVEVLWEPVA